jgi:hypothetical protein
MPPIAPTHSSYRYSNTFFVALNNRIYFRDHPFPGDSGNGPTNPSEQNLPRVRPLDIHVVTMRDTFSHDSLSSSTEVDKEETTSRCWTEGALFVTGIGIFFSRASRYPVVKAESSFSMRRWDRPKEPVVWSAVGMSLRSDISSLLWDSGVVLDYCPDI